MAAPQRNARPSGEIGRATGHVKTRTGKRGQVWYARYRLPDGHQFQRRIGYAWKGKGRPAEGWYTKRTAQEALDSILVAARRGELPEQREERERQRRDAEGPTFRETAREY